MSSALASLNPDLVAAEGVGWGCVGVAAAAGVKPAGQHMAPGQNCRVPNEAPSNKSDAGHIYLAPPPPGPYYKIG